MSNIDPGLLVDFVLLAILVALHSSRKYDNVQLMVMVLLFAHVIVSTNLFTKSLELEGSLDNRNQVQFQHQDEDEDEDEDVDDVPEFQHDDEDVDEDEDVHEDEITPRNFEDDESSGPSPLPVVGTGNRFMTTSDKEHRIRFSGPKPSTNLADARTSFFDKLVS